MHVDDRLRAPVDQPPVKDEDAAHRVASAWRPTLREIVKALASHDYDLGPGIECVSPVSPHRANHMRNYVSSYGETLVELPEEAWETSLALWMGPHWDVFVDLWTRESGRSDLVLHVLVFESEGGRYRFDVHLLYVP